MPACPRQGFRFAPDSGHGRAQWHAELTELAAALCLYRGAGSIPEAMTITQSDAGAFFASNAFAKHRDWIGAESKIQVAVVERLNGVIRSLGSLAKRL